MKVADLDKSNRITIISEDGEETKRVTGKVTDDRETVVIHKSKVPDWPIGYIVVSIGGDTVVSGNVGSSEQKTLSMMGITVVFEVHNNI